MARSDHPLHLGAPGTRLFDARFAALLVFVLLAPAAGAQQGAPKGSEVEPSKRSSKDSETEEFLANYSDHAARIKRFYSHVRGRAVRTREYFNPPHRIVSDETFAVDGDRFKLATTVREVIPPDPSPSSRKNWVLVAAPKLSFRLASDLGHPKYYVHWVGSGYGADYKSYQKEIHQHIGKYLDLSLEVLIKAPNYVVERAARDGSGAWAVELHGQESPSGRTVIKATVDPNLGWAIREFSEKFVDGDFEHTWVVANSFQGERDGVALLRKTVWTGTRSGKKEATETVENIELSDGPVPDSEFAISSFGIEGVDVPGPGRLSPMTFLSVAIATGAFVLSIAFRVLSRRKEAAETKVDGTSRDES